MHRHRVTVAFPCYQQVTLVREALNSILAQDYEPLEVIASDDASTDGTWEILEDVAAAYDGPHELRIHRNRERRGIENYNTLMELARGELIVIAHSDDVSESHRVTRIVAEFNASRASLVGSNALMINAHGAQLGLLVTQEPPSDNSPAAIAARGWSPTAHGATLAWHRHVFDAFGPINGRISPFQSDWILPFRAALLEGVRYIEEPLVRLRVHDKSRGESFLHYLSPNPQAHKESVLASAIAQTHYRLHTLKEHLDRNPHCRDELQEARATLNHVLTQTSVEWALTRSQLARDGLRPHWETVTSD